MQNNQISYNELANLIQSNFKPGPHEPYATNFVAALGFQISGFTSPKTGKFHLYKDCASIDAVADIQPLTIPMSDDWCQKCTRSGSGFHGFNVVSSTMLF